MTGSSPEQRIAALGLVLPPVAKPAGNYVPWRIGGGLLFLSGVGPQRSDRSYVTGQVGVEVSLADAHEAARLCGLALVAAMREAAGSLDRIAGILKVFGMVNAPPGFTQQPGVIDGCTDLLVAIFGDTGRPARSAVGLASLPFNIAVEIEAVALLAD